MNQNTVRPVFVVALLVAVGFYFLSRKTTSSGATVADEIVGGVVNLVGRASRGIRNNNPGNIDRKAGVTWRGMSADQSSDPRFVVFDAPEFGIRAIARVLRSYAKRGLVTVEQIINTWAPPVENDTRSYINAVAAGLGIRPDDPVGAGSMPALIAAIIQHENGSQPYELAVIARGIAMERGG